MTHPHIVLISVVRDFSMYAKCVGEGNPYACGCEHCAIDNCERNAGVPAGYNDFLSARPNDENAWYVFCHEDFQFLEDVPALFVRTAPSPDTLWGPIGAATQVRFGLYNEWQMRGQVLECCKDGANRRLIGSPVPLGTSVDTFDCQCLIVHSSLVQRHHLRFDECLSFDLYVEDFCMAARETAGIASCVLPFAACHWSGGSVLPRYQVQEAYVNAKYPHVCSTGTSSWVLGGAPTLGRRLTIAAKRLIRRCH